VENKINIENYEAYLLDMADGTISHEDREALLIFLEKHPEIDWDFDDLPTLSEEGSTLDNTFKDSLIRDEETALNRTETLMISSIEGIATEEEETELSTLLSTSEDLKKEFEFYMKTILPQDQAVFEQKDSLIKKEGRLVYLWTYASVAAAAILALFFLNLPIEESYQPRTAALLNIENEEGSIEYAFEIEEEKEEKANYTVPSSSFLAENNESVSKASQNRVKSELSPIKEEPQQIDPVQSTEQIARVEDNLPIKEDKEIKQNKQTEKIDLPSIEEKGQDDSQIAAISEEVSKPDQAVKEEDEVLTPLGFAKKVVKEDILKSRTLSETIMDEVADLTNDKIKLEKKSKGSQQFALNLGKLKITKK